MPPVFGPKSPSKALLWSCMAGICIRVFPSLKLIKENSSPTSFSSTTNFPPFCIISSQYFIASSCELRWSPETFTPFPPAKPSYFTTKPSPRSVKKALTPSVDLKTLYLGQAGILYSSNKSLAKDLDASIFAISFVGPTA